MTGTLSQLVQWVGAGTGGVAIAQGATLLLRRMNHRQVAAETRKASAEADAKLEDAEAAQAQSLVTVGQYLQTTMSAVASDAEKAAAKLRAVRALHEAHVGWDQEMTDTARSRGESPRPAPPLWPVE